MLSQPLEHLYKYRSLASEKDRRNAERLFTSHEVYYASRLSFNDPFDSRPKLTTEGTREQRIAYIKRLVRDQGAGLPSRQQKETVHRIKRRGSEGFSQDFVQILKQFDDYLDNNIGICCLTEKRDDILMWAHYADSHKGICIEFSATAPSPFSNARPVVYQQSYPEASIVATPREEIARLGTHTKAEQWAYEKEWRMIRPLGPRAFEFAPRWLTGVILGARISAENRTLVSGWVENHPTTIKQYEAKPAEHEFRIDINLIPPS